MIRIIENGRTKFETRCDRCLCDFEYELNDLATYYSSEYVPCSCCGHKVEHAPKCDEAIIYASKLADASYLED